MDQRGGRWRLFVLGGYAVLAPRKGRARVIAVLVPSAFLAVALSPLPADAAASSLLTRYPYLTDLTSGSVQVTWATSSSDTTAGFVRWGPLSGGTCTSSSQKVPSRKQFSVLGNSSQRHSVTITGLTPGTTYCYRVSTGSTSPKTDLLGSDPSPSFTTMPAPGSSAGFSFAVLGDWGDNTTNADAASTHNPGQAALLAQLASSNALFALSTGDIAYADGTQANYGDLVSSGTSATPQVSNVFGPDYWAKVGKSMPLFSTTGNHGRSQTFFDNWLQPQAVSSSNGTYGLVSYPSVDGVAAGSYPASWYAFTVGSARFYVLDADWADTLTGSASGGLCPTPQYCKAYQVDADAHWTAASAEYQWLKADLEAHPGGLKFAAFHYPLRSDQPNNPGDPYLQNSSANPNRDASLEKLLVDNKVSLAFNGHAHIYQRNVAPPGAVTSYVTGGGGAALTPLVPSECSSTDAYGLGFSSSGGSSCGAAARPNTANEVHHYLLVTVTGTTVTIKPTNANGAVFDETTYNFASDTQPPTVPAGQPLTLNGSSNAVSWQAATDNIGVSAYDVYRDGTYVNTVPPTKLSYTDTGQTVGVSHVYTVVARDLQGNRSGVSTAAPSAPSGVVAGVATSSTVPLSWSANPSGEGVVGYTVYRDGVKVVDGSGVTGTSFTDHGLAPGTTYRYTVSAFDGAGRESAQSSPPVSATTAGSGGSVVTVAPVADATIDPATSATGTSRLKVDASSPVNDALLKFTVPSGCTVTAASLQLTVGSGSTDPSGRGGDFYATSPGDANAGWSEASVTWGSAPAKNSSITPASITSAVTGGATYTLDVTRLVPAGGGTFTIRGSNTSGDGAGYYSKEGSTTAGPRLQLTCG